MLKRQKQNRFRFSIPTQNIAHRQMDNTIKLTIDQRRQGKTNAQNVNN